MNKIQQMIETLCPKGVEHVRMDEVFEFRNGYTPSKANSEYWTDGTIPWFRMEDIRTNGRILSDSIQHISKSAVKGGKYFEANSFILATTATIGEHALLIVDSLANQRFTNLKIRKSLISRICVKFMFYYLFVVCEWCKSHTNVSGFASVDMKGLKALEIPLPPLPIQQEIVKILDKFSALQAELEAELEAELVYRKQQYEYYRDRLIVGDATPSCEGSCHPHKENETPNANDINKHTSSSTSSNNVKWMKMGEVGTFTRGKRFVRTDIVEEGIPCIHYGDMYTYYGLQATRARTYLTEEKASKMRFAKKNDVVIVGAGENNLDIGVGLAWLGDEDVAVHDACYIFKSELNPRYVAHYLRTSQYHWALRKYVSEGKICSVSAAGIGRMMIPVPSLSEQSRIAAILDRFETLTANIIEGLPAEIAARRQQYEYYRDQLLTFQRKES